MTPAIISANGARRYQCRGLVLNISMAGFSKYQMASSLSINDRILDLSMAGFSTYQ